MFVAKPEMPSSSERNISFKDLMEIGSVEEARQRMIEKEVKSVIRDSHAQQIDWLEEAWHAPPEGSKNTGRNSLKYASEEICYLIPTAQYRPNTSPFAENMVWT